MAEPTGSPVAERKGFRAFVEKHDKLITTLGALIVFVGFFMKEGVRDQTKEQTSAISGAKATFVTQQMLDKVQETLKDPKHVVHSAGEVAGTYPPFIDSVQRAQLRLYFDRFSNYQFVAAHIRERFDANVEMVKELPDGLKNLEGQRSEAESRLAALNTAQEMMLGSSVDGFFELMATKRRDAATIEKVRKAIAKQWQTVGSYEFAEWKAQEAVGYFADAAIKEANSEKEKRDFRLKLATIASYILFAIGWTMSLIGKLLKLPALGGSGGE